MDPTVIFFASEWFLLFFPSLFFALLPFSFSELALSLLQLLCSHVPKLIVMVPHNYLSNRAHGVEKKHIVLMN